MFSTKKPLTCLTLPGICMGGALLLATTAVAETPVTSASADVISLPTKLPENKRNFATHLPELPECNTKSGALIELGDAYYHFAKPAAKKSSGVSAEPDVEHFRKMLADLEGSWVGQAVEKVCFLSDRSRFHLYEIEELEFATIDTKRRVSSRHQKLADIRVDRTRLASSDRKLSAGEVRSLIVSTLPPLAEMQHIEKLDKQYFKTRRMFRERAAEINGSILRERQDWMQITGNKLAWRTDWYTNGHYSGSELNVLKRR